MRRLDLTGKAFGKLTVIAAVRVKGEHRWSCLCECGNTTIVEPYRLRIRKSCGCVVRKHGHTYSNGIKHSSPEYYSYRNMIARCYNPKHDGYERYGGRGITVCDRWRDSFENFLSDMGTKPTPKHTIDRIESAGNYEPSNCRWATAAEQNAHLKGTHQSAATRAKRSASMVVAWQLRKAKADIGAIVG